nr:chemotaxis protein CheC [uncultured Bacillus sp.]
MGFLDHISSIHIDILKEIANIGAGNAATALSTIMNKKIEMKVPNVQIASFDEMMELAGGAETIVASVYLRIEGEAPSHMFFVLPLLQGERLIRKMTGNNTFSFADLQYDEMSLSAFQELGNILTGSYISSLSDFTGLKMYPSVPAICVDMIGAIISYGFIEISQFSDSVIVIETALNDTSDQKAERIDSHFFLFPDPDSFHKIFGSLGVVIDE